MRLRWLRNRGLRSEFGARGDHARRGVPPWLDRRRPFDPAALALPGEHLLPLSGLGDESGKPREIHFPAVEVQGVLLRSGDRPRTNFDVGEASARAAVELREELLGGSARTLRAESDIPGLRSRLGRRYCQALDHEARLQNDRSAGVLPCQLHEVLHSGVLVEPGTLRRVQGPEAVLLQHRRDGDRSGAVETGRLHESHRAVDGNPEKLPDLRARVSTAVPAGLRGTRGAHRAPVEPARLRWG